MKLSKAAKRIERATSELAEVAEQLGYLSYRAGESDVLKAAAIGAGIDHTREDTWIIEQLGEKAASVSGILEQWAAHEAAWKADLAKAIAAHPESLAREPSLRDSLEDLALP